MEKQEMNRLEVNHYNYLRSCLRYNDNLIISRVDNPEFNLNKMIAFKIEDKQLDNEVCFFQLSMKRSINKYFQLIKTEHSILAIRK